MTEALGFEIEWFDNISNQLKTYFLKFYMFNKTIEILEPTQIDSGRPLIFLNKTFYPSIQLDDLYLNNTLVIYNRLFTIKQYANTFTSRYFKDREKHLILQIPNSFINQLYIPFQIIKKYNYVVSHIKSSSNYILVEIVTLNYNSNIFDSLTLEIQSLSSNITLRSESSSIISKTINTTPLVSIPKDDNITLCLIKPHIVKNGNVDQVLNDISTKFEVKGVISIHLSLTMAEQLFDVYKNIFANYTKFLESITVSPCVAIILSNQSNDVVKQFREFCGPHLINIAKILAPTSLRAKYGETDIKNVIHCTDCEEDGALECKMIFELFQKNEN